MEGNCTLSGSSEGGLSSLFQSMLLFLDFLGRGAESGGVMARFSPRVTMLLSVSVVEVPELDMRLES